jgi:hypothetical protein
MAWRRTNTRPTWRAAPLRATTKNSTTHDPRNGICKTRALRGEVGRALVASTSRQWLYEEKQGKAA